MCPLCVAALTHTLKTIAPSQSSSSRSLQLKPDRCSEKPGLAGEGDEGDEGDAPVIADADGLHGFLEAKVLPWFDNRKKELANRPPIREQAFGEALNPDKLERLGRYEVHLDAKLECLKPPKI